MSKTIAALLTAVLMLLSGPTACDQKKYDVPAGGDRGDSVGDNQPCPAVMMCPSERCQPGQVQINPVAYEQQAPEVYQYTIFVDVEDEDCGSLTFKNKMRVERDGAYHNRETNQAIHMVWDDGKSGAVNVSPPYHTRGIIEKSIPHNVGVIATIVVTTEMVNAGAAWLTCRIERDAQLVVGPGSVGLARVAITGIGKHEVNCRTLT